MTPNTMHSREPAQTKNKAVVAVSTDYSVYLSSFFVREELLHKSHLKF